MLPPMETILANNQALVSSLKEEDQIGSVERPQSNCFNEGGQRI
jgi:hypothetical protein